MSCAGLEFFPCKQQTVYVDPDGFLHIPSLVMGAAPSFDALTRVLGLIVR